ncbi:hypothetical protein C0583_06365 [Candidatus Parcubacteria bacterium]|nr:MAG: hypothetical protein C0583_06365 [Candidatus Parcubacteria bacterium]
MEEKILQAWCFSKKLLPFFTVMTILAWLMLVAQSIMRGAINDFQQLFIVIACAIFIFIIPRFLLCICFFCHVLFIIFTSKFSTIMS